MASFNKVILIGNMTADPELKQTQGGVSVCSFSIAVNRRFKRAGEPDADFFNCVAFGRQAEFVERYLRQGTKIVVCGRLQTGSYTNRDGVKVNTVDIVVEEQDFAESKAANGTQNSSYQANSAPAAAPSADIGDGFMNIPDGIDEELPFN